MAARFKFVRTMMGNGWPSGHVAVDHYETWPERPGGGEWCLTGDAQTPEELSLEIDKLIGELEDLRAKAPKEFARWKAKRPAPKARRT